MSLRNAKPRNVVWLGLHAVMVAQFVAAPGSHQLQARPRITGQPEAITISRTNPDGADMSAAEQSQMLRREPFGSPILGATYIGGSGSEQGMLRTPVAVAPDGSVYVGGWTNSGDFPPALSRVSQTSYVGQAAFVVKLSPDLNSLLAVTVLDGIGNERISGIALGPQGDVYVVGNTTSSNLPATAGAFDRIYNGTAIGQDPYNEGDVFVAKLSANLGTPEACTFLGGSGAEHSHVLAVGADGSVVVAGSTESVDFPHSDDAYDTIINTGGNLGLDAFVVVLDAYLHTLLAGTYIGGSGEDFTDAVVVSPDGDIYVGGWTNSTDYPSVAGKQMYYGGGSYDGFLSKFNPTLTTLSASTFLGGAKWDMILALCLDSSGAVFATGHTASRGTFPISPGCYDPTYNGVMGEGTTDDCFVSKFSSDLAALSASTYLGGSLWDVGLTVACDSSGRVAVANTTNSGDFPVTDWSIDSSYNGGAHDLTIAVLSNDLTQLYFTTYIGGSAEELYPGLALSETGGLFVAAATQSSDMPYDPNGYDQELSGAWDIHVTGVAIATFTDRDGDGVVDLSDNCVAVPNPTQLDANSDGVGDACCCVGVRGNVNYTGIVDLSDLSALVSYLTGGGYVLPCPNEANVNATGIVDLGDLSALVSYLTGGGYVLPSCP